MRHLPEIRLISRTANGTPINWLLDPVNLDANVDDLIDAVEFGRITRDDACRLALAADIAIQQIRQTVKAQP